MIWFFFSISIIYSAYSIINYYIIRTSTKQITAVIAGESFGYWENIPIRYSVYEFITDGQIIKHVSNYPSTMSIKTEIILYIDSNGHVYEKGDTYFNLFSSIVFITIVILKML